MDLLNIVSTAAALPHTKFSKILNGFENHRSFSKRSPHELDTVVSLITNSLNTHNKKYEGLLLLRSFLGQCQLDIIEQKGSIWLSLCTKICAQKKPAASVCLSYDVINEILSKSIHIPDLVKSISSNLLGKIIESVNDLPSECHLSALRCLETCMKLYAGPCGSSRAIIERFLTNLVDSNNHAIVVQTAKCLHLLQQVRGGGTQGLSQKAAWSMLQTQLLGSLHETLDLIYANTAETYDHHNIDGESVKLKTTELKVSAEPVERATQLVMRFQNLCEYLRVALSEPFPVAKAVQPANIFSLIARGLTVNCTTLSKNLITDNVAIGALLPQIHVSLLRLLDTLILLMGSNLLPLAEDVCQLLINSLKWTTSGKASGFQRPYISIRQATYRTIGIWCKVTKYGSLMESIAEELIKFIIQDVTPFQSEVTLKVLSGSRKYLSKKARQRLQKAQNDASNIAQTHSKSFNPHNTKIVYTDNGNEPLCSAALLCLVQFLYSAGCFIKPAYQKILQENIVAIALNVARGMPKQSNLYHNDDCRNALYAALNALVLAPSHLCPPPLQYAAEVFTLAQVLDVNAKVRERCSEYLRSIEKILHPQKEVFYFPTDANDVAEAFRKDANKNRIDLDDDESDDEESDVEINIDNEEPVNIHTEEPDDSMDGRVVLVAAVTTPDKLEIATESEKQTAGSSNNEQEEELLPPPITEAKEDPALSSPPRKSARLSAKRGSSTERDTPSPSNSPLPRRRSTRLSSITLSESSPTKPEHNQIEKMTVIEESNEENKKEEASTSKVEKKGEKEISTSKSKTNEDDMFDELAAAFVEEFIDEEVDE